MIYWNKFYKQLSLIRANANTDACSKKNLSNILSVDSCLLPVASSSATTLKSNKIKIMSQF